MYRANGGSFCAGCGKKRRKGEERCPFCGAPYTGKSGRPGTPASGGGGVGWSEKADDPFFRAYALRYIRGSLLWLIALSILVPLLLLRSGQIKADGEGLAVTIVVPAVFWIFGVGFLLKKYGQRADRSWDGVITDKKERHRVRKARNGSRIPYVEYVLVCRREDGGTEELLCGENPDQYRYYSVGDRIRYHNSRYLKCVEKYDKSRDTELRCAACGRVNDIRDDYCGFCGAPMLKGKPGVPSPADTPALFCGVCGSRLAGGAFCPNCGARIP